MWSVISDILIVFLQNWESTCEYDSHICYFGNHHHSNRFFSLLRGMDSGRLIAGRV